VARFPRNLGAFCGQIAPMVAILPVVPGRKYCAVYYLAHDSYHGMEEVIGSIPIRSTNKSNNLADSQKERDTLSIRWFSCCILRGTFYYIP
jgi:hypothetical protein